MSGRVEIVKRLLDAYNDRDWDTIRAACAEDMTFYDNALHIGGTSRDEFIQAGQRMLEEAPDDRVFDTSFIDAGQRARRDQHRHVSGHPHRPANPTRTGGQRSAGGDPGMRDLALRRAGPADR